MTASTQVLGHHRTCRQCQRLPLSLPASPSPCCITCPQFLKKEVMELQGLVLMLKGLKKFLDRPSMDLLCLEAGGLELSEGLVVRRHGRVCTDPVIR